MKKIISIIISISMITMLCLSASAGAYYEYDNKMSSIGMRMTSALYVYSNSSGGLDISGLTRIETGSSPSYTSVTMYSRVVYRDIVNYETPFDNLPYHEAIHTQNNVLSNSAFNVPEHYLDYTGSIGVLQFLYHSGSAESGGYILFSDVRVTRSMSSIDLTARPEADDLIS